MQSLPIGYKHIFKKTFHWSAVAALILATVLSASIAQADPGDLDTTFGTSGKVTTSSNLRGDRANALVIHPNDKIIVAGKQVISDANEDFLALRFTSDGKLDTDFSTDGKASTDFSQLKDSANAVALQSNDYIILAGKAHSSSTNSAFALVRYKSDGDLDEGFSEDGRVTLNFNSREDVIHAVVLDENEKIVVAGTTTISDTVSNFALARFDEDGSLDPTFGTDGTVTFDFGSNQNIAYALAIDNSGNIYVAGTTGSGLNANFALAKLDDEGNLDSTFGAQGKVTTNLGNREDIAYAMALDDDRKILLAGVTKSGTFGSDIAVVRYETNGDLDTTFDTDGVAVTDIGDRLDTALAITVQNDDKIVVAGKTQTGTFGDDMAVVRYESDGDLDTTFNIDGIVITSFTNNKDIANGVALQFNGKIITAGVAGDTLNSAAVALARYSVKDDDDDDGDDDSSEDEDRPKGACFISTIID